MSALVAPSGECSRGEGLVWLIGALVCSLAAYTARPMFPGPPQKGFYRSANAIFGKVGRIASEEVVLQLLNSKCIPVLLYGLEACPLLKSDLSSVDFVIVRFLMKLFVR